MAEFEPPSFSLGFDFDLDSEPQATTARTSPSLSKQARQSNSSNPSFRLIEEDDDFEIPEPPRTLKRLRRGLVSESSSSAAAAQKLESVGMRCSVDDEDIEEFSSQEDRWGGNEHSSIHYQSGCSSSKFPLRGHGVLTKQSATQRKVMQMKEASSTPALATFETSSDKHFFPKLTVSPLRRFQLLDSDTDEPSVSEDANREANNVDSSMKEKQYNPGQCLTMSEQKRMKASASVSQTEDLWKDFCTEKSFHIPTPALDEFCEEYFSSEKDKNGATNLSDKCKIDYKGSYQNGYVINNDVQQWKGERAQCRYDKSTPPSIVERQKDSTVGDPIPPAHRYFFHNDPRIQNLVSSRLSYFFPLGAVNNRGNEQSTSSVIDYMSQFNHGDSSKQQAAGNTNADTISRRGRKNSKKSNVEEVSQGFENWVNPKSKAGIPKDAGKRRVHADGQSGGHWYTGPDGNRVYVTKNGQELSGKIAYIHYRKESGAGFKKSKKKTAAKNTGQKKKTSAKKGTAAKRKPAARKK